MNDKAASTSGRWDPLVATIVTLLLLAPIMVFPGQNKVQAVTGSQPKNQKSSASTASASAVTGTRSLTASITFAKNPIVRGQAQTIRVAALNAISHKPIAGAAVNATVTYATGATTKHITNTTDTSGQASLSWKIGGNTSPGTFKVTVDVSAPGYKSKSFNTTFNVLAK
jgi:hypothetical protein